MSGKVISDERFTGMLLEMRVEERDGRLTPQHRARLPGGKWSEWRDTGDLTVTLLKLHDLEGAAREAVRHGERVIPCCESSSRNAQHDEDCPIGQLAALLPAREAAT